MWNRMSEQETWEGMWIRILNILRDAYPQASCVHSVSRSTFNVNTKTHMREACFNWISQSVQKAETKPRKSLTGWSTRSDTGQTSSELIARSRIHVIIKIRLYNSNTLPGRQVTRIKKSSTKTSLNSKNVLCENLSKEEMKAAWLALQAMCSAEFQVWRRELHVKKPWNKIYLSNQQSVLINRVKKFSEYRKVKYYELRKSVQTRQGERYFKVPTVRTIIGYFFWNVVILASFEVITVHGRLFLQQRKNR